MLNETSLIIVTHNHLNYIETCLNSLSSCNGLKIIVVDNNSVDGTPDFIKANFPSIKLIKNNKNIGYGKGVNLGVKSTQREYIVVLNPDTIVRKNAIEELIKPLKKDVRIITTPKVLIYDGSRINTCGNIEHFTGLAFTRGLGKDPNRCYGHEIIRGFSGVCFAMKRENYWEMGGFDEQFFLYMEDVLFSWMANIRGYKIHLVSQALVNHDYNLKVNPKKIYYLERGRYIIIRKFFTWQEYLSFAPSFMMTEILTSTYALLNGFAGIKYKLKAVKEGWGMNIIKIKSDKKKLLKSLDWTIPEKQLSGTIMSIGVKKIANMIYKANYRVVMYDYHLETHHMH